MTTEIPGVLLAAGGSKRLNQPKQLLKINDSLLINHIISVIRQGGIERLLVILGSDHVLIRSLIHDQNVHIIVNERWEEGISTSIRSGIKFLNEKAEAAMLFVVDQPFLSSELICQLTHQFQNTDKKIAAPKINNQQCNPVIFSKTLFPELLDLKGKEGGKKIIKNHPVEWVQWDDETLLLDIDTEKDYLEILKIL